MTLADGLDAWNDPHPDWSIVGQLGRDADNPRRLVSEPGEGILGIGGKDGTPTSITTVDRQHSGTITGDISRIGWIDGGQSAWWDDEDMAYEWARRGGAFVEENRGKRFSLFIRGLPLHPWQSLLRSPVRCVGSTAGPSRLTS